MLPQSVAMSVLYPQKSLAWKNGRSVVITWNLTSAELPWLRSRAATVYAEKVYLLEMGRIFLVI